MVVSKKDSVFAPVLVALPCALSRCLALNVALEGGGGLALLLPIAGPYIRSILFGTDQLTTPVLFWFSAVAAFCVAGLATLHLILPTNATSKTTAGPSTSARPASASVNANANAVPPALPALVSAPVLCALAAYHVIVTLLTAVSLSGIGPAPAPASGLPTLAAVVTLLLHTVAAVATGTVAAGALREAAEAVGKCQTGARKIVSSPRSD